MKMRVMAFGDEIVIRRLTIPLAREGIEVVGFSDVLKAAASMKQERYDLAIVDSRIGKARLVCHCIGQLGGIPVVLMIRETRVDWRKLQSLAVDGYIPDWVGQAEMAARLRSIVRRHLPARGVERGSSTVFQNYVQNITQSRLEDKTGNGMENDKGKY